MLGRGYYYLVGTFLKKVLIILEEYMIVVLPKYYINHLEIYLKDQAMSNRKRLGELLRDC